MPDFMNPFVNLVPRQITTAELVQALRIDMAAEIEAINIYESHHDSTDNVAARRVLAHVIAEEKEHLAEFLELVKMLDPEQIRFLDEAPGDVAAMIAVGAMDEPAPAAQTPPLTEAPAPPSLTVGSLISHG